MFQWSGLYWFIVSFGSSLLMCKEYMHISSLSPNCTDIFIFLLNYLLLCLYLSEIYSQTASLPPPEIQTPQFSRLLVKGQDLHFCVSHCHFYYAFLTMVLINQNLISFATCRQYRILSNKGLNPVFLPSFSHTLSFILWYSYLLA